MTRFARADGSKASNKRVPEEASSWIDMKQQLNNNKSQSPAKNSLDAHTGQKNGSNCSKTSESKEKTEWCAFSDDDDESNSKSKKQGSLSKVNKGKIAKKKVGKQKKNYVLLKPQNSGSENDSDEAPEEVSIKKTDDSNIKKKTIKNGNINKSESNNKNNSPAKGNDGNKSQILYNKKGLPYKKKLAKVRDNQEHKSRKPNREIEKIFSNGKFIEVIKYDGFPVMKEDFERLVALRKSLISKGIPKSEVKTTMLKERRRAEKAFAREKKKVCFQCRKSGHVLSECPELGQTSSGVETAGTGICFKCGSTEHTYFQCKVVHTQEFKFAECFICKEKGHIARQCPDNPRGLYPKGGGCRICGSVTHLKKDCPQNQQENEERAITLSTNASSIEGLENDAKPISNASKTNKNIIKF